MKALTLTAIFLIYGMLAYTQVKRSYNIVGIRTFMMEKNEDERTLKYFHDKTITFTKYNDYQFLELPNLNVYCRKSSEAVNMYTGQAENSKIRIDVIETNYGKELTVKIIVPKAMKVVTLSATSQ